MTGGCWDSDDDVTMACLGQRLTVIDGRASLVAASVVAAAAAAVIVLHVAVRLLTVVAAVCFTSTPSDCF